MTNEAKPDAFGIVPRCECRKAHGHASGMCGNDQGLARYDRQGVMTRLCVYCRELSDVFADGTD